MHALDLARVLLGPEELVGVEQVLRVQARQRVVQQIQEEVAAELDLLGVITEHLVLEVLVLYTLDILNKSFLAN